MYRALKVKDKFTAAYKSEIAFMPRVGHAFL